MIELFCEYSEHFSFFFFPVNCFYEKNSPSVLDWALNTPLHTNGCCRQNAWVCLTILWSWHLKDIPMKVFMHMRSSNVAYIFEWCLPVKNGLELITTASALTLISLFGCAFNCTQTLWTACIRFKGTMQLT